MAGAFKDYVRDESDKERLVAEILKDNPTLSRKDLEFSESGIPSIKEEVVKDMQEKYPARYISVLSEKERLEIAALKAKS
jgi:hypothetical protein